MHSNRVLKELRVVGTTVLRRRSLLIMDPVKLTQMSGFDETYLHRG